MNQKRHYTVSLTLAGNEIRTRTESLEGSRATITPYPHFIMLSG